MTDPGVLSRLSESALRYGAALALGQPAVLTTRLYGFNRLPLAPKLVSSLPNERQLRAFAVAGAPQLTVDWRSRRLERGSGWLHWIRRDGSSRSLPIAYKLYISPSPEAISSTLRTLTSLLTASACVSFKLGSTPSFLARPDKLVAYFADRDEMLRVGREASDMLAAIPVHGVPFSFPIDSPGMVSYGVDPPHDSEERTSWRLWLCSELAEAMTDAGPGDAVEAARARLRSLGIDPVTWQPSADFWARYGSI